MLDISPKAQIHARLTAMSLARLVWEEGTQRAANSELYGILEGCFELYTELKDDTKMRRALTSLLIDLEMKPQVNTSLGLKVIRFVFGKQGQREQAYAKTMAIAYDLKPKDQPLTSYIEEMGGIEEMRRQSAAPETKSMTAADYKRLAVEAFQTVSVSVSSFKLPTFIQPNSEYDEDYVVALVRCNPNGTGDLLYGCSDAKIIDSVLTASGKDLDKKAQDAIKGLESQDQNARRAEDVKRFTPQLFASLSSTGSLNGLAQAVPAE